MAAPAVSIIVPVHNSEPFLARCLDSICGQSLRNIEIICVDDGSSDKSVEIMKEYAVADSRVCIVSLGRNQGVSVARNIGIEIAHGKWLGFVDSDDSIELDFYEKLYAAANSGSGEIIKGIRWSERDAPKYINLAFNEKIRKNKFFFTYEWTTAIYYSDLIRRNNIHFIQGCTNSEDVAFLYEAVVCSKNIVVIDDAKYNYFLVDNSANTYCISYTKIVSIINAIMSKIDCVNKYLYGDVAYINEFSNIIFSCSMYSNRINIDDKQISCKYIAKSMIKMIKKCKEKDLILREIGKRDIEMSRILKSCNEDSLTKLLLQDPSKRLYSQLRGRVICRLSQKYV